MYSVMQTNPLGFADVTDADGPSSNGAKDDIIIIIIIIILGFPFALGNSDETDRTGFPPDELGGHSIAGYVEKHVDDND